MIFSIHPFFRPGPPAKQSKAPIAFPRLEGDALHLHNGGTNGHSEGWWILGGSYGLMMFYHDV